MVKDKGLSEEEKSRIAMEEAETEEEQRIYKRRQWNHRLRLGRHYRMERFSMMFSTLVVLLFLFGFAGWNKNRIKENELVGTQAKYTESVEFSLSGLSGSISDIFRSKDGKRAFMIIEMDDVDDMSLDATNYELFISGFNNKAVTQEPASSMFIFGSSGYVGLEFYDERGLVNEIFHGIIRNNSAITELDEFTDEDLANMDDSSFGTFDQAEFYVNLGAEGATVMDALDDELDAVQLYYALIGHFEEDEIYDEIDKVIEDMGKLLAREKEYSNRIVELGYEAPSIPDFMDGDYVDEDGLFHPRSYVNGAHRINYVDYRLPDGYLSQVIDESAEFREYMANKRADEELAREAGHEDSEEVKSIEELGIRNSDKKIHIEDIRTGEITSNEQSLLDAIANLETTRNDYLQAKRDLQIDYMRDLLLLEADVHAQSNAFSTHSGEDFLYFW